MNIFWHEIKQYGRSTIIWIIALLILAVFYLSLFSAFSKDVETVRKIFENYPPAIRAALGIQLNVFFTINGFYLFIFSFVLLVGAIQAANLGIGIISKEAAGKTFDFLLTKPITRTYMITRKIAAALTLLVITNIVYVIGAVATANIVSTGDFEMKKFILISLTLFLVQLMFFVIGLFLSAVLPKIKSPVTVSLPLVFAFYIIGALDTIFGSKIRYLTPFKFYDLTYIIKHGSLETKFLLLETAFIVVVTGVVYYIYNKKDIPTVD